MNPSNAIPFDFGWLRLSAVSGGPGETLVVVRTIQRHTGRVGRSKTFAVNTSGSLSESCVVSQQPSDEFVKLEQESVRVGDGESSFVITGSSNSEALTVAVSSNVSGITVSRIQISTDNGSTWTDITNEEDIDDDPGAEKEYRFKVTLSVGSEVSFSSSDSGTVSVSGKTGGHESVIVLLPSQTTQDRSVAEYSLSNPTPLTITGLSNSASLTLGGSLVSLGCTMQVSFDYGRWIPYTIGSEIVEASVSAGSRYRYKVIVNTSSLSAGDEGTLDVYDNSGVVRATTTVGFVE